MYAQYRQSAEIWAKSNIMKETHKPEAVEYSGRTQRQNTAAEHSSSKVGSKTAAEIRAESVDPEEYKAAAKIFDRHTEK